MIRKSKGKVHFSQYDVSQSAQVEKCDKGTSCKLAPVGFFDFNYNNYN